MGLREQCCSFDEHSWSPARNGLAASAWLCFTSIARSYQAPSSWLVSSLHQGCRQYRSLDSEMRRSKARGRSSAKQWAVSSQGGTTTCV